MEKIRSSKLTVFATVAENKSFSKAARELYISQPAVSLTIQKLENELGVTLFNRTEQGVELTHAGMVLYKYARKILDLTTEAETEINRINGIIKGKLTLGATLTIGEYILPEIIGGFKQLFPEVEVLLHVQNTEVIVEKLLLGHYDLALIEGLCDNPRIQKKKFLDDEIVLIASNDHPWSKKGTVTIEEVCRSNLILREPGSGTRLITERALAKAGVDLNKLNILMELGSSEAIKASVASNLGVAFISKWTLQKELKLELLKIIKIKDFKIPRSFNIITDRNRSVLTHTAKEFIKYCKGQGKSIIQKKAGAFFM
ncbi:MAG: LysR family transcriptional regulator [Clostridia bacterium]|nr:LysR family transcriptional regulator [Clostridia bacterium]